MHLAFSAVGNPSKGEEEGAGHGGLPGDLLSAIFEAAVDGIMTIDAEGGIESFNPAAERLFGYRAEEVLGRNVSLLMPNPTRSEHDGHLRRYLETGEGRIIGAGRAVEGLRRDGTRFPLYLAVNGFRRGARRGFVGIIHDLSKEKALQGEIRRHLAGLEVRVAQRTRELDAVAETLTAYLATGDFVEACRRLLRNALDLTGSEYGFVGVLVEGDVLRILAFEGIVWDAVRGRGLFEEALRSFEEKEYIDFSNLANLFGVALTAGEPVLSNDPASDMRAKGLPPGHPPLRSFLGLPFLHAGTPHEGRATGMIGIANRPGGYGPDEVRLTGLLARAGAILHESQLHRAREVEAKAQLLQSQKAELLGQLAGGIAHDFNNVLAAIYAWTSLLDGCIPVADESAECLAEIQAAAEKAGALVRQLLAFGRKDGPSTQVIDLNETVRETKRMLDRLIGSHIRLVLDLDTDIGRVKADPSQTMQILVNLAVNARDAMPTGGELRISTARRDPYIQLTVTDTGCGMPPDVQRNIFDPYFSTKEKDRGTGLGLATVQRIVRAMGGEITVASVVGRGTTFRVLLPPVSTPRDPSVDPPVGAA